MQRQELEKLGWTTRGLSYLENRLQSCQDEARKQACYRSVLVFASPLFQEMWQRELQGLTEGRAHATGFIGDLWGDRLLTEAVLARLPASFAFLAVLFTRGASSFCKGPTS